ncbi:MAG: O-antigen ligase family protein [Rhodospirillales bacterium]
MPTIASVLFSAWFLLPFLAAYASKGLVPLLIGLALLGLALPETRNRLKSHPLGTEALLFLPFFFWAGLTVFWSLDSGRALKVWLTVLGVLLAGRCLVAGMAALRQFRPERAVLVVLLVGVALTALMAMENSVEGVVIKWLKGDAGRGVDDFHAWLNAGNNILAIIAWPTVWAADLWAKGRFNGWAARLVAPALFVLIFGVLAWGLPTAPPLALALSAFVFLVLRYLGTKALIPIAVLLVAGVLFYPYALDVLMFSHNRDETIAYDKVGSLGAWSHRWAIWEFTFKNILTHPVIGWGLDSSRFIPGGRETAFHGYGELMPLHPHSSFLQVWLELGGIGALLMAGFLGGLLMKLRRPLVQASAEMRGVIAFRLATVSVYMCIGLLSFGIWQNWWLATGLLSLGLLGLVGGPGPLSKAVQSASNPEKSA